MALILKDCYNYSVIDSPFSQLIFESVSIIVEVPGCDKFVVTSLYRPPTCPDAEFFDILDLHLSDLEKFKLPVFICTDSNYNLLKINTEANSMQLVEAFSAYAYSSLTMKATRFHGESRTCIDQIWTNKADKVSLAGICLTTYSNHFSTVALIKLSGDKVPPKINNSYRKFSETNISKFKLSLANSNWDDVFTSLDTNTACDKFIAKFNNHFEKCFPLITRVNINTMPINKFMTPALLKLRAKNLKLVKRYRLSPSPVNKENSRIFRNFYNGEVRKGKLKYYKDLFAASGSDSKIYGASSINPRSQELTH